MCLFVTNALRRSQAESRLARESESRSGLLPKGGLGCRILFWIALLLATPAATHAGGSGLNVLVVANSTSPNSLDLANYYREQRNIPPSNLLRVPWTGGRVSWDQSQFNAFLLQPVLQAVNARGLSNQIDFVVLSMDIPYRIESGGDQNATTSALFYGFKTNDTASAGEVCRFAPDGISDYYGSETVFREGGPANHPGYSYLATFITADTLAAARQWVDQGVMADGLAPTNRVILAKTSDPARNVRFKLFDNTVFDTRIFGGPVTEHLALDSFSSLTGLGGIQTGLARFAWQPGMFSPGALADSLTSFGGELFEPSGQTNLLAFLSAGAAGSYGTISEPCNFTEKFPDPLLYLYQRRGFSLAECYYQSLVAPYQGVVVGDALSAPFRKQATGAWQGLVAPAGLTGLTNLTLSLTAPNADHPIQRVELFLDGARLRTLTNITPRAGNRVRVTVNSQTATYIVPQGATLRSVTTNLGNVLRGRTFHDGAQVDVWSYGDRLELQSLPTDRAGSNTTLTATADRGAATEQTLFVRPGQPAFLDTIAHGWRACTLEGSIAAGDILGVTIAKTNGENIRVAVTNTPPATSLYAFVQSAIQAINDHVSLRGADGVFAQDLMGFGNIVEFNLLARGSGRTTSTIQTRWDLPAGLQIQPGITAQLDERPNDLQPRNHIYVSAGVLQMTLTFALDTTALPDGPHELRAVVYEGSSVATQTHFPVAIEIRNSDFAASLDAVDALGSHEVGTPALFAVTASAPASRIEWFSTGGKIGEVADLATTTFSVDGNHLGAGRHQVFAVATDSAGRQCRTRTLEVVFLRHPPITLAWAAPLHELSWNGLAGFRYEVLAADALGGTFAVQHSVTATNTGALRWTDPDGAGTDKPGARFYRVRGSP